MPERGVDAINIAAHIIISLQEVIAREIPSTDHSLLLVGKMEGGTTCNVVEISQNVATFRESRGRLRVRKPCTDE